MLVLSILAFVCHALSLCASLDFYNRDGQHLEHKQHTMVCGYVYGAIAQGDHGLQALRRDTSISIPTLTLILYNLHQRTDTILRLCLPRYATLGQEEIHSFLVPCGMLYGVAVGPRDREWELRTVSSSSLNITFRHVAAIWDKMSCDLFPNLRITDSGRPHSTLPALNVTICGNSPQQTHISGSNKVNVLWLSRMFDVNKERFLLSYETVVPGYANYYSLKIKVCNACSKVCAGGEAFSPLLYKGTKYTYTWYITGGVLTAPTVHINKFACNKISEMDETIRLTIYDAPLSLLDPTILETDPSRVKQALVCSEGISKQSHKSSIGDLTLISTMRNDYEVEFSARVVFARILCNDTACSAVTYNLSLESVEQKTFWLLSQGTSQQRALFLPPLRQESSFITFDELEVHFEGFTHMPCAMGGLFLYYLQPLGLIEQVCSAWTARIWSGALKQEDGSTRLHLGHRAVMFVIKTYRGFTEGTIKGRVMLGNCLGVINPGFRGKPVASPYYNSSLMKFRHFSYRGRATTNVVHQSGCIIFQYFQTDVPDCVQRSTYSQQIWHRLDKNLQGEIKVGMTSNMSDYPASLIFGKTSNISYYPASFMVDIDIMCNYRLCTLLKHNASRFHCAWDGIRGRELLFLSRRPGSNAIALHFDTFCLAAGVKMFFQAYFVNIQPEVCWTAQALRKWIDINAQVLVTNVILPPVPCLTLQVNANILRMGVYGNFEFPRPEFTNNLCCVLHLSILSNPRANVFHPKINVVESFVDPIDLSMHGIDCTWKYPLRMGYSNDTEINGLMYALKRVSLPLNGIHADISLQTELWGAVRHYLSPFPSTVFLELAYNFTLYSVTHPAVKMLKNYTCAVATNSCYSFAAFGELTWNSAVRYCSALNMSLITTPTDFEWNFISHLFAQRPDILKMGSGIQLSYMGLLYNWVSFIYKWKLLLF